MSNRVDKPAKAKSGSETRQRQAVLRLRVTDAERGEIESRAERAGLSVAGYLRALAFGKDTPQPRAAKRKKLTADMEEIRQLLYELRKIGGNLNQIAHHMNRGEETPPEIIRATLAGQLLEAKRRLGLTWGVRPWRKTAF